MEKITNTNENTYGWKRYWDDTVQYQRILEILDDYWITQKDEAYVEIDMKFIHKNGESQMKHLVWRNPDLSADEKEDIKLKTLDSFPEKHDPFRELLKEHGMLDD